MNIQPIENISCYSCPKNGKETLDCACHERRPTVALILNGEVIAVDLTDEIRLEGPTRYKSWEEFAEACDGP